VKWKLTWSEDEGNLKVSPEKRRARAND